MFKLKKKTTPKIRYCGSLIAQNYGEPLKGHGYSLWDLKNKNYTHHEIENDYGHFTIEIQDGKLITDISNLPNKTRLRVKCYGSITSEVKSIIASIKEKTQVIETAYVRMDQEQDKKDVISLCKNIVLTDLTNVDYQSRLISEFISKKLKIIDKQKIDDVLKLNKKINSLIKKDDFTRSLKWKPIRFEWDNMFTYGEENYIDFSNMDGLYGIFGPNKSGKSSVLSAIIFCLFDKFDRGFKGVHVLNVQKTSFKCKLEFDISGTRYFIERKGTITRSGNVKVDVKFWKVVDDVEEELHGTERRDTNDIIRDYIGTYEDFILTTASFQSVKNLSSFIDMGNSERKDLLVQFMGLNIFDKLHDAANERNKELNTLLKIHKDKNYPNEIQENTNAYQHTITLFDDVNHKVESLKKQIHDVNNEIIVERSNLIKLDSNVPTNIEQLQSRKITAETAVKSKRSNISILKENITSIEINISKINDEIKKIEDSKLDENYKKYKILSEKMNSLQQIIELKKVKIREKLEKVRRLHSYEYNPDCKYCVNNSFVKDATKAKQELSNDKIETDKMMDLLDDYRMENSKLQWVEKTHETYTNLLADRNILKDKYTSLNKNMIISTNELERMDESYKNIIQQIELYQKNEESVKINLRLQSKIDAYKNTILKLELEFKKQHDNLMELAGKKELFNSNISRLKNTLSEVSELEYEFELYQNYLITVGRDGVSYQVICNAVPEIEKEVNSILNQVVDYTIHFETDGKNIIPYIVYEHGKWPIELTSGYERFVASIAIRVALTEVSTLPRCGFLAVDEGFGTLDPDNLASMSTLFSCLKSNFEFIIIISHLDTLKDIVDKTIDITLENGFSKVKFR